MDILDNLKLYVDNLDANIDNVNTILEEIFSKSYQEQLSKLDNMNKAKFNIMMAYVIDTLLFVYLKTNGVPTKDHPIMKELDRVKKYFIKIQKLEKNNDPKAKVKLDKDAAGRMIKHALNNSDQMNKQEIESSIDRLLNSVAEEVERIKKAKEEEEEEGEGKEEIKDTQKEKEEEKEEEEKVEEKETPSPKTTTTKTKTTKTKATKTKGKRKSNADSTPANKTKKSKHK